MIVAFKRPQGLAEHLVAWWTAPGFPGFSGAHYAHMEIAFTHPERAPAMWSERGRLYLCGSSTSGMGIELRYLYLAPNLYDLVEVPCTDDGQDSVLSFFLQEFHCAYDWLGILRFVFPWIKPARNEWFCSEAGCTALSRLPGLKELGHRAYLFSPNAAAVKLRQMLATPALPSLMLTPVVPRMRGSPCADALPQQPRLLSPANPQRINELTN
jgi:hypothetical protein